MRCSSWPDWGHVSREGQYKDVYRRTIEIPQRAHIFKPNCCFKAHNAHINLAKWSCVVSTYWSFFWLLRKSDLLKVSRAQSLTSHLMERKVNLSFQLFFEEICLIYNLCPSHEVYFMFCFTTNEVRGKVMFLRLSVHRGPASQRGLPLGGVGQIPPPEPQKRVVRILPGCFLVYFYVLLFMILSTQIYNFLARSLL